MKDIELTVSDIKDLMNTIGKNRLGGMKLQQGNFCLEINGCKATVTGQTVSAASAPSATAEPSADAEPAGNIVKSPIVGTFYAGPSPDKPPYVAPGSTVKKGDVLFIVESMKLMNEVTSEFDGTVGEIFAQNGLAVEYGQAVMTIE